MGWIGYFQAGFGQEPLRETRLMDSEKTADVFMEAVETSVNKARALDVPEWAVWRMASSRRGAWEKWPGTRAPPFRLPIGNRKG